MKEYIEREILQKAINTERSKHAEDAKESLYERGYNNGLTMAYALLLKAPVADVEEVVRCKDCVNSRPIDKERRHEVVFYEECVWCQWFDTGMCPDEYCSYGKRKMDKEE